MTLCIISFLSFLCVHFRLCRTDSSKISKKRPADVSESVDKSRDVKKARQQRDKSTEERASSPKSKSKVQLAFFPRYQEYINQSVQLGMAPVGA